MSYGLYVGLLKINCKYNFKISDDGKCYSKECMMNVCEDIAKKIKKNGCLIYCKKFGYTIKDYPTNQ